MPSCFTELHVLDATHETCLSAESLFLLLCTSSRSIPSLLCNLSTGAISIILASQKGDVHLVVAQLRGLDSANQHLWPWLPGSEKTGQSAAVKSIGSDR